MRKTNSGRFGGRCEVGFFIGIHTWIVDKMFRCRVKSGPVMSGAFCIEDDKCKFWIFVGRRVVGTRFVRMRFVGRVFFFEECFKHFISFLCSIDQCSRKKLYIDMYIYIDREIRRRRRRVRERNGNLQREELIQRCWI